eukprot:SAG31_NODE_39813_length_285_cov_0.838710_1_plen_40_part_10
MSELMKLIMSVASCGIQAASASTMPSHERLEVIDLLLFLI